MKDYSEDMAICAAATDGPWDFGYYNVCSKEEAMELAGLNYDSTKDAVGVRPHGFGAFVNGSDIKVADSGYSGGKSEDNARYVSHFNPLKVREMLERISELEAFVTSISEASLMEADDVIKATFHGYIQYAEELLK